MTQTSRESTELATFAGGCFWCTEAIFERVDGVLSVRSGYTGGHVAEPTYREVCSGRTGHAEAVQFEYDPEQVSYDELLDVFFATHDPTTLNRQGADVGTQYRSAVFTHSPEQKRAAEEKIRDLEAAGAVDEPIVTEVAEAGTFYEAELSHQDYYRENPDAPYCQYVIRPKIEKFEKQRKQKPAD